MGFPEPASLKYRAFISYSHADARWAKWLHRALETFRIDKDLVGRETTAGTIPRTLRPIFRDRDDFTAGHSLTEQTLAALDASAALIVICSPASAKSRYVNEEVRLFKSRHPERPVIPLIAGGRPGDAELECFPPAVKFKLDAEGQITGEPVEVLAADVRDEGDGKTLSLAKVVAGLLGVSSDDIFRRAERERRRKGRLRTGVVVVLALLTVAASGSAVYAWQQLKTNRAFLDATLHRATQIVNKAVAQAQSYGVPRKATLELLAQAESLFDDMARLGQPTPELRHRKALMLLEFANNYYILGDTAKQKARAEEAHRIMTELAAETHDDPEHLGTLAASLNDKGDVLVAQGDLAAALEAYRKGLATVQRLIEMEPENTNWERDLSVYYEKIGVVLMAQGNLAEAMRLFKDGLAIADRLAKSNPRYPLWQEDLARSYSRVGDALAVQGHLAEALESYRESLAIMERLADADPNNIALQRGLFFAYTALGSALVALHDHAEALAYYRKGQTIAERAAKADPSHARWQHSLGSSHQAIGDTLRAQGDLAGASEAYGLACDLISRLSKADPNNTNWQRDLADCYYKIGDMLAAEGSLAEALASYRESLATAERLTAKAPDNAEWQRQLAISHGKVALVLAKQGEAVLALDQLRRGRAIIARLNELSPDVALFPDDLARFDAEIARLEQADQNR